LTPRPPSQHWGGWVHASWATLSDILDEMRQSAGSPGHLTRGWKGLSHQMD
jgi:hypothetical protein